MTRKQLRSWQAAYNLKQDLMSLKSYLQHEAPNKKDMVIREPITAVFHLLLLLLLLLPQCLEATSSAVPDKSVVSKSCSKRGYLQRPNLIEMLYVVTHTHCHPLKSHNSTTVKAEFLVKERRILNSVAELLWPLPWILSEVHVYNSLSVIF